MTALAACCACAADFTVRETPSEIVIDTAAYQAAITREGFGVRITRGGEIVVESAQPADPLTNLSFDHDGSSQHVTKLLSHSRTAAGVTLEYQTSFEDAVARVELSPGPDTLRVTVWLLSTDGDLVPSLRYRLAPSGLWYGGGFQGLRDPQVFPLNTAHLSKNAFLASSLTQGTPVWYATKGVAIWVRTPHDFRYSINRNDDGLLSIEMPGASALTYDIFLADNIREAVDKVNRTIGWPHATPPADYFKLPIYTTWVEYKTDVSQRKVLEFAHAIHDHKLPCGVIEIDDKWESRYGDMQFDKSKFPDPKAMNDELHKLGYRVTLWVHPFVNLDSAAYADERNHSLLLHDANGRPGLARWWNGDTAVWDFSNPKTAAEFRGRLARLQETYGFDGFKFDGGDANLVPRDLHSHGNISALDYPDIYNREAAAHFPWEETRVGVYSQPLGVVQRLIDKQSRWGLENGLAAIIPEAITVSMRGFPYVMPDMVGGNQYDGDVATKEMLIRWAQASALMPLLQFSIGPWHFDEEATRLAREASELHSKFAPYIVALAQAAPKTGQPILRPIWYNEPADEKALSITDQFMVGTDILVAPVMNQGATSRNVYLPAGRWRDAKTGKVLAGGQWLNNYPAPLDTLPLFLREGSAADRL